jgi:plastocyanin
MPSRALPRSLFVIIGLLLLLSGCGATSPASPAATATPAAAPVSPTPPPPSPTAVPATATATAAPPTRAPTPTATSAPAASPTTAATAAATAVPATPKPAATGEVRIEMVNLAFQPATITVPVGTTVVWVNAEAIPHTVAHKDLTTFSSEILAQGDTFRYTFTQPGEYPYLCTLHPEMIGTITVR